MSTNNELIISPPFTDSNWYLSNTCQLISKDENSFSFKTTIVESGLSFKIPTSWHGRTVTVTFNISSTACIRIQNADNWDTICELSSGNSPFTLTIPQNINNMALAIVSPNVANTTITISSLKISTRDLTKYMTFAGMDISRFYIGNIEVKKIFLKDKLIYENIKLAELEDTLYNKVTNILFILKEDALSYDEENLKLEIDDDIINVEYDEVNSNLDIGGDDK